MREFILFGLCAIGICFSSCEKESKIDNSVVHGYFQYSYVNHAWGKTHSGWIIDKYGNVKSYNNPQKWNEPDSLGYITEEQLIDNLSYCNLNINTISSSNLTKYNSLVESASKGKLSNAKPGGNDMGIMSYYCYWYDTAKGKYKQILLSQDGDWSLTNSDYNAIKIDTWMKTIKQK
jgi:hypothetical protein